MAAVNRGKWICPQRIANEEIGQTQLVCFRKELSLSGSTEEMPVRISADNRYKLYVNGALICFGPCKGDDKRRYADELNLRPFLKTGRNVLAVEVLLVGGDAWNSNHSLFTTGLNGLYLEGIEPEGWRCHACDTVRFLAEEEGFSPLHIHEEATGDPAAAGWKDPGFDDSAWDMAQICADEGIPMILRGENLLPRPIPFMEQKPHGFTLPLCTVAAHSEERFVLDAGEEMTAFLTLALSGGKGAVIELLQSECYVMPEGKGNRLDHANGHLEGYTDSYTVAGFDREVYEPFWFRTFRFLQVTIRTAEEPLELKALRYDETGYPLAVKTSVTTSDPTLTPVWDISLRTLRRCMHDTYMDCPFYEQLQYVQDTRSEILYTYAVSADDRLARQAIDDFACSQRPDGLLNACYPNKNANVIPGFSLYYILILHDHMMYFGEKGLIRQYLPTVERILQFFCSHRTQSGLVDKVGGVNGEAAEWSFIDWAAEWMPTTGMPTAGLYGPLTMESLLYLYGLQKAAELADWIGETALAGDWRGQAEALHLAIRQNCLDESGMLTDGPGRTELSQQAQVFGVLTGTLTEAEGRQNLLRTVEDRTITQCTVAMCFYLFRALEKTGLYEYTDRYWDIWRGMVHNGCTTCVESPGSYARSECHAWGSLALYELPTIILGVRPAAPGYEKIEVRPAPGVLTSASGTVHTPRGNLNVAWKKSASGIDLQISGDADAVRRIIPNKEQK